MGWLGCSYRGGNGEFSGIRRLEGYTSTWDVETIRLGHHRLGKKLDKGEMTNIGAHDKRGETPRKRSSNYKVNHKTTNLILIGREYTPSRTLSCSSFRKVGWGIVGGYCSFLVE